MSDDTTALATAPTTALATTPAEQAHEDHTRLMATARALVQNELDKLLRLSQHPDFQAALGPVPIGDLIKLLEAAAKDYRLATGQSTENVSIKVGVSNARFDLLTQEERNTFRELALRAGVSDE